MKLISFIAIVLLILIFPALAEDKTDHLKAWADRLFQEERDKQQAEIQRAAAAKAATDEAYRLHIKRLQAEASERHAAAAEEHNRILKDALFYRWLSQKNLKK